MNPSICQSSRIAIRILFPCIAMGLIACTEREEGNQAASSSRAESGVPMVHNALSGGVEAERLATMRWMDVGPTAEACFKHELTEQVLEVTAEINHEPCLYLRGLLYLSLSQPTEATKEWARIEVSSIPPMHLYAPWRLHGPAGSDNPYHEALLAAVDNGLAGELIAARVHASRSDYEASLRSYLLTNPEAWSSVDLNWLRVMSLHEPYALEARRLAAGALRANTAPPRLRRELALLIREGLPVDDEAFRAWLMADPEHAKAALAAAKRLHDMRLAFAANRFEEVCRITSDMAPDSVSDETVVMALLAHARMSEREQAETWAMEWRLRRPGSQTETWLKEILNPDTP